MPWYAVVAMKGAHLIVVGAGIIGSSIAREAASRGAIVTVLEAESTPASGASGAAAGALHPLTGMRLSLRKEHLNGFALTRQWLSTSESSVFSTTGIMRLVCKDKQAALWRERVTEISRSLAYWVDVDELKREMPLVGEAVVGGVFIPEGTFVDVPRWIAGNLARERITTRCDSKVARIDEVGANVEVEVSSGETLFADMVVVAAGLDSHSPLVDVSLDWRPYKGEMGVFEGVVAPPCPLNHRGYVTEWRDGRVLIGVVDSHPPFDEGVRPDLEEMLKKRASQVWQGVTKDARMIDSWCGVRPALADREPKLGIPAGYSKVAVCTGHGGRGLLTGPLSAVAVCQLLQSEQTDVPATWLL